MLQMHGLGWTASCRTSVYLSVFGVYLIATHAHLSDVCAGCLLLMGTVPCWVRQATGVRTLVLAEA